MKNNLTTRINPSIHCEVSLLPLKHFFSVRYFVVRVIRAEFGGLLCVCDGKKASVRGGAEASRPDFFFVPRTKAERRVACNPQANFFCLLSTTYVRRGRTSK